MTLREMAVLLAKIRLGDNRQVDEATVLYWHDTIGDMELPVALAALKQFRREWAGTYLEPGHLLELAGVSADPWAGVRDLDREGYLEQLDAAGVTEAEVEAHRGDRVWVEAKFGIRELEAGESK